MIKVAYSDVAVGHGLGGSYNVEVGVDVDGGRGSQAELAAGGIGGSSLLLGELLGDLNLLRGGLVSTTAQAAPLAGDGGRGHGGKDRKESELGLHDGWRTGPVGSRSNKGRLGA